MSDAIHPGWESSKQRTRRIALDYYKRLTWLDVCKWSLSAAACALAGGYVLWTMLGWAAGSEPAARQFSPGPVASAHQAWDGQCAVCHARFTSLRADAHGTRLMMRGDELAANVRCQVCHYQAGAAHHDDKLKPNESRRACASCHHDHRGIEADLTRLDDTSCTSCHADLNSNATKTLGAVTVFGMPPAHPPFSSLAKDPGRIKFNHVQHMLPGQFPADVDQRDPNLRRSPIQQLTCAYCHEADDASAHSGNGPATTLPRDGAYLLPIRFDQHCAACHRADLYVSGEITGQIPHGLAPPEVRSVLLGLATSEPSGGGFTPQVPIPGKTPNKNAAQQLKLSPQQRLEITERQLWDQAAGGLAGAQSHCAKCHDFQAPQGDLMPAVWPASIPAAWFKHARFDHAAHRAVHCLDCHADAQSFDKAQTMENIPLDNAKVMIPAIEKCRECHAPRTASGGGARYDCAECHRYHGGDFLPHGPGAAVRGVPEELRRTATEFMRNQSPHRQEPNDAPAMSAARSHSFPGSAWERTSREAPPRSAANYRCLGR